MSFAGFPKETFRFLQALEKNNNKSWFDAHRSEYEAYYVEPAKRLVDALGPKLKKIDPTVQFEAKINKSLFRINRDIRFSKDKTPYKAHIDFWFWRGNQRGWETPGFFMRIMPSRLILGAGIHCFGDKQLHTFRQAVLDKDQGRRLSEVVNKITSKSPYRIGGATRKTVPRGFDPEHERAKFLLHEGLHLENQGAHPPEIFSSKFVGYCEGHFKQMAPINGWLAAIL